MGDQLKREKKLIPEPNNYRWGQQGLTKRNLQGDKGKGGGGGSFLWGPPAGIPKIPRSLEERVVSTAAKPGHSMPTGRIGRKG